jgi:hypothetical protein
VEAMLKELGLGKEVGEDCTKRLTSLHKFLKSYKQFNF